MARIKKKVTKLEEELLQGRSRIRKFQLVPLILIVIGFAGFFASIVISFISESFRNNPAPLFFALIPIGFVFLIIGRIKSGNGVVETLKELNSKNGLISVVGDLIHGSAVLKSGVEGEEKALKLLSELPDSFSVIPDYTVTTQTGSSQMDFVVISKKSIWVVENKNLNGRITGTLSDRNWRQDKVGRGGNAYGKTFYNPAKQVATHVFRLKEYLNSHGYHHFPFIQGVVFFSNDDALLEIEGDEKHPVIHGKQELLAYLIEQEGQHNREISTEVVDFLWGESEVLV